MSLSGWNFNLNCSSGMSCHPPSLRITKKFSKLQDVLIDVLVRAYLCREQNLCWLQLVLGSVFLIYFIEKLKRIVSVLEMCLTCSFLSSTSEPYFWFFMV